MSMENVYTTDRLAGARTRIPEIVATVILVVFALGVILPLIIPFFFVFKTRLEFNYNPWALPKAIRWDNFVEAWKGIRLDRGMLNTVIVCAGAVGLTVPMSAMAGYVFARYRSTVTEIVFYFILGGFFVPIQMVLIPLVRFSAVIHTANTLPGVFLPMAAFGVSFWTMITAPSSRTCRRSWRTRRGLTERATPVSSSASCCRWPIPPRSLPPCLFS